MDKREKVIAELERVADEANPWKESPPLRCDISYPLLIDALALLKAQELVKPKWRLGYAYCGECGFHLHWIVEKNNYCPECGRAVKWDE